jgi:L-ascorbate metabolism protein UlaG (beta-lactamase superfamily)
MNIRWIGHSCFLIDSKEGKVLTDPFNEAIPYGIPDLPVDVVTVSHEHFDHNAVERVQGDPEVVRGDGPHTAAGITFQGVPSFHDPEKGKQRGPNTIFVFTIEGIRLAHFGDLGHPLTDAQKMALSQVEAAFIPVGGHFTIGPDEARDVVKMLPRLKVVFPMHYKTDKLSSDFPIVPVDKFTQGMQNIRKIGRSEVALTRDALPGQTEVWILDYA